MTIDLQRPANDQTEAAAEAEYILRRIYALPVAKQRRVLAFLSDHRDPELRALAKPLEDVLTLRRLIEGAQ